jgi:glycosyl hydrolase family 114
MRGSRSLITVLYTALGGLAVLIGTAQAQPSIATAAVGLPPVNGQFDYQIGGPYTPLPAVAIVDRDRSAAPVPGKYNICYVNAFQTQPGEAGFWTGSHSDLLLKNSKGKYVIDPDWPDEYILDTSTAAKRAGIAGIVNGWLDGCARAGFQAIEPDNLDSWTRSKNLLTKADNVALATLLATHAHGLGLAIAQKNTSDLGSTGKTRVGFDFAIAEECQVYRECGDYLTPYGKNVIEIEYTDNPRSAYTAACAAQGKTISVILRDRDVVPKGESAYRYEAC